MGAQMRELESNAPSEMNNIADTFKDIGNEVEDMKKVIDEYVIKMEETNVHEEVNQEQSSVSSNGSMSRDKKEEISGR